MKMTRRQKTYVGIYNDEFGGMTPTGSIVKDAWIFGLIPESQTCEGWTAGPLQLLYDQTSSKWEECGYRVSNLPEELRQLHERIHREAIERA